MPPAVCQRLRLETVPLSANQTIHDPRKLAEYVFFPTRGLIPMVAAVRNGLSVEISMVGHEGMFNVASVLGDDRPSPPLGGLEYLAHAGP